MLQPSIFHPPRRKGALLQGTILLALSAAGSFLFYLAMLQKVGGNFVLYLLGALALFSPIPLLAYRLYALLSAAYTVERDGLRLRWGLRGEDIPLPDVEWVRPAADLGYDLHLPLLRWPGSITGSRSMTDLGTVEFMASEAGTMLLVATPRRVYAISPANTGGFMRAFQQANEMGSLTPISSLSALPAAFLQKVWADRISRFFLLAGLALTLALFVRVSLVIPTLPSVSLGFDSFGRPLSTGPAERLLLFPVLAALAYVLDVIAGLVFYRREPRPYIAYTIWASSSITPLLLLADIFFLHP